MLRPRDVACHDCDLLHRRMGAPRPVCGALHALRRSPVRDGGNGVEGALALSLASLVLIVVAKVYSS